MDAMGNMMHDVKGLMAMKDKCIITLIYNAPSHPLMRSTLDNVYRLDVRLPCTFDRQALRPRYTGYFACNEEMCER